MNQCTICLDEIKCSAFTETATDDVVDANDSTCLRLKCGHAFHTSCIVSNFRVGGGCPTCREPLREESHNPLELLAELANDFLETSGTLDDARAHLRRVSPQIQEARRKMNIVRKEYRKLSQELIKDRARIVKDALKVFRKDNRSKFVKTFDSLKRSLEGVKEVERSALLQHHTPEEVAEYMEAVESFDYDAEELMATRDLNSMDPLEKRFWR